MYSSLSSASPTLRCNSEPNAGPSARGGEVVRLLVDELAAEQEFESARYTFLVLFQQRFVNIDLNGYYDYDWCP